ncbi:uncharacterized protein RAG0_11582 [Rhynchosporium agropyri]|uniref:Uncharacterized protein n=1 Tax=Rhynchosporium agropyri TaxID=914238 RepID=A0A1E1L4Q3_9HELO|nr:uncharacterized protein RAG0_11582 [Rhynchosporium agropyri]
MAIGENYSGAFHLPVDYGVDLLQCVKLGNNPLIIAAEYGHLNIVKLLLDCEENSMALSTSKITAIIYAIENRRFDVMALLLDHDLGQAQAMRTTPHLVANLRCELTPLDGIVDH